MLTRKCEMKANVNIRAIPCITTFILNSLREFTNTHLNKVLQCAKSIDQFDLLFRLFSKLIIELSPVTFKLTNHRIQQILSTTGKIFNLNKEHRFWNNCSTSGMNLRQM